jgi:hypothetical protein
MNDNTSKDERVEALSHLADALGRTRNEANDEVNWLLVGQSNRIITDRDAEDTEAAVWEASLESQLAALDDAPSTDTDVPWREAELSVQLTKARQAQLAVTERFNTRRNTFAAMLNQVRDSRSVLFMPETVGCINDLNRDGFLAESLGMDSKEFAQYYGAHEAPTPTVDKPFESAMTRPPMPVRRDKPPAVDFTRDADSVPVTAKAAAAPSPAQERTAAQPVVAAQATKTEALPEAPEREDVPGFDF